MRIRRAELDDLIWLKEEAQKFISYHPSTFFEYNEETFHPFLQTLISDQVVLIAEGNERMGFIAGVISPCMFAPDKLMLQELAWWVGEDHRHTTTGMWLLKAFEELGKMEEVSVISMSSTVKDEQRISKLYERNGYKKTEVVFTKEI